MAVSSSLRLLVLHGLRVKGLAEPAGVAAAWDVDEAEVAAELKSLAADGLVQRREGRVSGWSLTASGREAAAAAVAEELAGTGARDAVQASYRGFLAINGELLGTCTAWQLKPTATGQSVNDHADADYDAAVVARLVALHERATPVLDALGELLARFGSYRPRLDRAVDGVRRGDTEWFTKPLLDSYHTVWFELHEDLLATLGLERASEGRT